MTVPQLLQRAVRGISERLSVALPGRCSSHSTTHNRALRLGTVIPQGHTGCVCLPRPPCLAGHPLPILPVSPEQVSNLRLPVSGFATHLGPDLPGWVLQCASHAKRMLSGPRTWATQGPMSYQVFCFTLRCLSDLECVIVPYDFPTRVGPLAPISVQAARFTMAGNILTCG